ncbi:MAG TPA: hypothetical protein VK498_08730 [Ferruginibacter sp.]|nr:hypothetical protein [Ferruginibacter sp.]
MNSTNQPCLPKPRRRQEINNDSTLLTDRQGFNLSQKPKGILLNSDSTIQQFNDSTLPTGR